MINGIVRMWPNLPEANGQFQISRLYQSYAIYKAN